MSLTSTAVAYIIGRLVLQRYKDHLERENWPYAVVQKEVDRNYVARHYRELRTNRSVASVNHDQSPRPTRYDRPVVRVM